MLYKIVKVLSLLSRLSKRQERATSKLDLQIYFFSKIEFAALAPKKNMKALLSTKLFENESTETL
jgi:hypothetical protein